MKSRPRSIVPLVLFLCLALLSAASQQDASAGPNVVPDIINYSGILKDATGRPLTGVTGITFLLYAAEQGGVPLWLETQNVMPEKSGRYSVQTWSHQQERHPTRKAASIVRNEKPDQMSGCFASAMVTPTARNS